MRDILPHLTTRRAVVADAGLTTVLPTPLHPEDLGQRMTMSVLRQPRGQPRATRAMTDNRDRIKAAWRAFASHDAAEIAPFFMFELRDGLIHRVLEYMDTARGHRDMFAGSASQTT